MMKIRARTSFYAAFGLAATLALSACGHSDAAGMPPVPTVWKCPPSALNGVESAAAVADRPPPRPHHHRRRGRQRGAAAADVAAAAGEAPPPAATLAHRRPCGQGQEPGKIPLAAQRERAASG
jgi:hypothetical protein